MKNTILHSLGQFSTVHLRALFLLLFVFLSIFFHGAEQPRKVVYSKGSRRLTRFLVLSFRRGSLAAKPPARSGATVEMRSVKRDGTRNDLAKPSRQVKCVASFIVVVFVVVKECSTYENNNASSARCHRLNPLGEYPGISELPCLVEHFNAILSLCTRYWSQWGARCAARPDEGSIELNSVCQMRWDLIVCT